MVARIGSSLFLLFSSLFPLRADTASFFGLLAFFFQDFCPVRFRKQFVFLFFSSSADLGLVNAMQHSVMGGRVPFCFKKKKKRALSPTTVKAPPWLGNAVPLSFRSVWRWTTAPSLKGDGLGAFSTRMPLLVSSDDDLRASEDDIAQRFLGIHIRGQAPPQRPRKYV